METLKSLASACREAGYADEEELLDNRRTEADRLLAIARPGDLRPAWLIAAQDAWHGREREYALTCTSVLDLAKDTKDPNFADRAARICSMLPTDGRTREAALVLARRAVELGKDEPRFSFMQLGLGMVEYRSGHWPEAEQVLAAAATSGRPNHPNIGIPAAYFRAMALFRQEKRAEARQLLTETAAKMTPLPKNPKDPLAGGIDEDVLIHWIAYREALALIGSEASPTPSAKP